MLRTILQRRYALAITHPLCAHFGGHVHEFTASRMMDFVLVRHGESEGNVARKKSIRGDHSLYSGEFKNRHSLSLFLSRIGR